MYVRYITVRFIVTKPDGRPITVWQDQHLVAEVGLSDVNKMDSLGRDV